MRSQYCQSFLLRPAAHFDSNVRLQSSESLGVRMYVFGFLDYMLHVCEITLGKDSECTAACFHSVPVEGIYVFIDLTHSQDLEANLKHTIPTKGEQRFGYPLHLTTQLDYLAHQMMRTMTSRLILETLMNAWFALGMGEKNITVTHDKRLPQPMNIYCYLLLTATTQCISGR